MKAKYFSALSLVALVGASSSVCTESFCYTIPGSQSISPVPTTTTTKTITSTTTTKSVWRQTITVTPAPVLSTTSVFTTSTATVTTVGSTDTFTTATIVFVTDTSTEFFSESTTITSTLTIESPVATTTVPTTDGFIPIQSQIAAEGFTPAKRDVSQHLEDRQAESADEADSALKLASYPARVTCVVRVKVIETYTSIATGRKTATTTIKPETSIITSTSTVSTTTTITQSSASVTITDTSTSTLTTSTSLTLTNTFTSTLVTTAAGPTATVYAVCETASNYLKTVNGEGFNGFQPERDGPYLFNRSLTDAVSCCNACQAAGPSCAVGISNGASGCFFFAQDSSFTCDAGQSAISFTTSSASLDPATTIFNGNCGRFRYNRQAA